MMVFCLVVLISVNEYLAGRQKHSAVHPTHGSSCFGKGSCRSTVYHFDYNIFVQTQSIRVSDVYHFHYFSENYRSWN